jgi:hypothetical protein
MTKPMIGGQTADRAVVREEVMGPFPAQTFYFRENVHNNEPVLMKTDTPGKWRNMPRYNTQIISYLMTAIRMLKTENCHATNTDYVIDP